MMKDFYWYRRLRGGIWVCVFQYWVKVPKRNHKTALEVLAAGYNVEDHRYFKKK